MWALWIILGILALFFLLGLYTVKQQTMAVVQRWGKFLTITEPGIHWRIPIVDTIAGRVSLRVRELNVNVRTKTQDNVFVDLLIAVQYYVVKEDVWKAFYMLTSPGTQMESYVFDVVRAKVPTMLLDDVFEKKDEIALDVQSNLRDIMPEYGYSIKVALVNDIQPDKGVADAMNEINRQQRLRVAAEQEGEAKKILVIKAAEADATSKELSGVGVAKQRQAIVEGLRVSVENFKDATGVSEKEVMAFVALTQYYDMLTDIGKNSKLNTIMVPHGPGSVGDLRDQLIAAIKVSEKPSE
jgi:regulator of protease activity HflC (stomatin/prohibitin superfamily)